MIRSSGALHCGSGRPNRCAKAEAVHAVSMCSAAGPRAFHRHDLGRVEHREERAARRCDTVRRAVEYVDVRGLAEARRTSRASPSVATKKVRAPASARRRARAHAEAVAVGLHDGGGFALGASLVESPPVRGDRGGDPRSGARAGGSAAGERLPNLVKRLSKKSFTLPMGPWRCLPMITSAWLRTSSIWRCQAKCSSVLRAVRCAQDNSFRGKRTAPVRVLFDRTDSRRSGAAAACPHGSRPDARAATARSRNLEILGQRLQPWVISLTSCTRPSLFARGGDQLQ